MTIRALFALMLCAVLFGSLASAIADGGDHSAHDQRTGGALCLNCGMPGSPGVGAPDGPGDDGAHDQHGLGYLCSAIVCTPALPSTPAGPLPSPRASHIIPRVDDHRPDVSHAPPFRPPRLSA